MVAPGLGYRFEGILTGRQETLWSTVLGAKDARLAVELAGSGGGALPLTSAALELYEKAASRSEDADISSVGDLYRRR